MIKKFEYDQGGVIIFERLVEKIDELVDAVNAITPCKHLWDTKVGVSEVIFCTRCSKLYEE